MHYDKLHVDDFVTKLYYKYQTCKAQYLVVTHVLHFSLLYRGRIRAHLSSNITIISWRPFRFYVSAPETVYNGDNLHFTQHFSI